MKNSNLQLLCFFFLLNFSFLQAQQLPIFTQYREYQSFINPATISPDYLTQEYNFQAGVSYRTNISGIEDAPTSVFARGEYIFKTKAAFDLAVGGYLLNYDTDPFQTTGAYGKIAALFSDDPFFGAFSVGLTFGALQYRVDVDNLKPFHLNDAIITEGNQQQVTPDVGFGAFYYKQFREGTLAGDVMYGGVSVPQLLALNTEFKDDNGAFAYQQQRHFYGIAGLYKYFNELTYLHPSVWIKYVPNAPVQIDFNAAYQFKRLFWLGTGFSTSKILHFEGGVYVNTSKKSDQKSIKIGYGFDYATGDYNNIFGTAHEVNVAFFMDTRRKK